MISESGYLQDLEDPEAFGVGVFFVLPGHPLTNELLHPGKIRKLRSVAGKKFEFEIDDVTDVNKVIGFVGSEEMDLIDAVRVPRIDPEVLCRKTGIEYGLACYPVVPVKQVDVIEFPVGRIEREYPVGTIVL